MSLVPCPCFKSAFTLVELMISIAMVVILMIGVHQVFKMSSDTISIGNQVGDFARNNRSVQQTFHDDFNRLVHDAPLFILRSGVSSDAPSGASPPIFGTFNTEAERLADRDGDPLTQDLDGNGQEGQPGIPGELTPLSIYNNRNHRVDIVGFPVRGLFRRATANDGSYTSSLTSQDAFIFYEHLALPPIVPGAGRYYGPGEGTYSSNLQNFYASQWVLGRVALLMRDPPMTVNGFTTNDNFIARNAPGTGVPDLSPLRYNSATFAAPQRILTQSRYDLLGASLETLRQDATDLRSSIANTAGGITDGTGSTWWLPVVYRPVAGGLAIPTRFDCNPRITKPVTSEAMAQAMPILLNNCSQFIVEYAGDFVKQHDRQFLSSGAPDPDWGNIEGDSPDGVIDYVVDHTNVTNTDYVVSAKVRWYGLPRDTNGDGRIIGYATNPANPRARRDMTTAYNGDTKYNELIDVVPLWDVLRTYQSGHMEAAFERELPLAAPASGDYAAIGTTAEKNAFRYTCVFANSAPAMIRIVLKLEDPAGRLSDGQWYEYVVTAP